MSPVAAQLDLFAEPSAPRWWLGEGEEAQAEHLAWERRALSDMAEHGLIYECPGFMGAVCERLLAKGLAAKEFVGFRKPPESVTPRQLKAWGWRSEDHPLFRYTRRA